MCGIAGIYSQTDRSAVTLDRVLRMMSVMTHRGPDESGVYIDDRVGMGHCRLSIIDLAGGTQPIHNEDESMWIVYNGEVFNYPELRSSLEQAGHRFYTNCDTEVVLHLYEQSGPAALQQMNGQFALAIWDSTSNELFLARDRMGIRPLHYVRHGDSLLFASEIKSLFTDERIPRRIDPRAMGQIFTFWTTLTGATAFEGVHELPPGHYMKVADGRLTVRKYWDIPLYPRDEQTDESPQRIASQVRELLADTVRIRLRADVPVGCYVSGGLDSSAIAAMISAGDDISLQTFGIRFEESEFDEGSYQRDMVNFLGSDHSEMLADNSLIGSSFADVLWHCEKPLLRTSPAPLYLLSRLVRDNDLKVVLTGEGADEVFGGYNIFKEAKVKQFWARYPNSRARAALVEHLYPYIFNTARSKLLLQSFFRRSLEDCGHPLFSHLGRWTNTARTKTFFSADLAAAVGSYDPVEQLMGELPASFGRLDCFCKAQYVEMMIFMSNYLLSSQGDRVAMANSVEIRLPFLDYRVMEFMGRVPSKWKMLGLNEKHLLKSSLKSILPAGVVGRSKHPYRAPIKNSLLDGQAGQFNRQMLSESAIRKAGLFEPTRVAMLLKKTEAADRPSEVDSMALAGILSAQIVHHQFIENFPGRRIAAIRPDLLVNRRQQVAGGVR